MSKFYSLKVKGITQDTADTVLVSFEVPTELKKTFVFTQGQFLTLKKRLNGEEIRRSYSLCSSPLENSWEVAIKKINKGVFSTFANTILQVGDYLDVMPPDGQFTIPTLKSQKNNYVAFAAGSGITPILSMIKTHLATEPESTFKLFYLNKTSKTVILKEKIEQLKNIYFNRFHTFYFLTREKRDIEFLNGRFTDQKIDMFCKTLIDIQDTNHCFICGPKDMIFLIKDRLVYNGLDASKIHFELFYAGDDAETPLESENLTQTPEHTQVTITEGGRQYTFGMDNTHDNILDAALATGADLPYACKGGVCSTCKCKLEDGEVHMKKNFALEEDEVKNNFILSCQALPKTKEVKVNFDV